MDLEAGKDIAFVCYVFQSDEIGSRQFPIIHQPTVEMLYTAAFDELRRANKAIDEEGKR